MKKDDTQSMFIRASDEIKIAEEKLDCLFRDLPVSGSERLHQIPLFVLPHVMRRIIFFNELYKKILSVNGVFMEFGVRYGRDLAIVEALRAVHEPLNYSRKIIGFDTFSGFPSVDPKDGDYDLVAEGALRTTDGYDEFLIRVLEEREKMSPFSHLRKFEIIKGDAPVKLREYLEQNPQTIISMAYFDMDIYQPTKQCLELIKEHTTKGSVLAFDELNCSEFPGETIALKEVFGLGAYKIQRFPHINPGMPSFIVLE